MRSGRPLWKVFILFLAPMLLSNILQSLSGTLNNVYIGQMLGVGAHRAIGACPNSLVARVWAHRWSRTPAQTR